MAPPLSYYEIPNWSEPPVPTKKVATRMYVLVNEELPPVPAGIQSAHAVADFTYYHRDLPVLKDWIENHKTLVILSATIEQMSQMKLYFLSKNRQFVAFTEPDLDNLETAVAFEPMTSEEGKILFGKFKLYK